MRARLKNAATLSAVVAALAFAAPAAVSEANAQETLNITAFGGNTQNAQRKIYFEPYMKETGVEIKEDNWTANLAPIEAMVTAGNTTWDVINMSPFLLDKACDSGLLEPIDYSKLPAEDMFSAGHFHECGIKSGIAAIVIAYNSEKFPADKQPSKLEDFWDVENFPGKRGLRGRANQTLEFALISDGVSAEDLHDVLGTEEGLERAFRKLDTIKEHIVWWDSYAQPAQLLVDGEVVMSLGSDGRFSTAIKSGQPIKLIWDGAAESGTYWSIIKGTDKYDQAMHFIAFANRHDIQVHQPEILGYAAPLKSVMATLTPDKAKNFITWPDNRNRVWREDAIFWADNLDEYTKRFKKWQAE